MAKEEIVASLQNAVNRGEPLERAMQTMITAGYPDAEVRDSARYVGMGIIGKMPQNGQQPVQQANIKQPVQQQTQAQQAQETPKKKTGTGALKVAILVLVLLVLIGILGFMFFGSQIMSVLKPAA